MWGLNLRLRIGNRHQKYCIFYILWSLIEDDCDEVEVGTPVDDREIQMMSQVHKYQPDLGKGTIQASIIYLDYTITSSGAFNPFHLMNRTRTFKSAHLFRFS